MKLIKYFQRKKKLFHTFSKNTRNEYVRRIRYQINSCYVLINSNNDLSRSIRSRIQTIIQQLKTNLRIIKSKCKYTGRGAHKPS